MKLLVTGGAGFIGSNFIHYWLKNHPQDQIINFDSLTYAGNLHNLKSIQKNPNYSFVKGDIIDLKAVNQVMKKVDMVVHFAAESHVDRSITGPSIFVTTNVIGTQVLLESALNNKIKRFHHISTDEVFGSLALDSSEKFNENTQFKPNSPYSASKAASDHLVRAYHQTYDLPTIITNCSNNYGPFQFPEKLIPLVITNLLENKKIPVYGDGKNIRDWLYVKDHCRAIDLSIQKGKFGETYCIGGMTEDISNLQLIKKIIKLMNKSESAIEFVKDRLGHDRRYAVDYSKASKDLGYKPEYDLDTYLIKTINWYQENKDWWQTVKSGD
ncbi:MAG: dTDP-glucose 4,6-dehydratase, partial [Patescibacteria group bacterium]|nr:dTDP-glucose 4,6-dehydratase [Patescibacteria group bacterium]